MHTEMKSLSSCTPDQSEPYGLIYGLEVNEYLHSHKQLKVARELLVSKETPTEFRLLWNIANLFRQERLHTMFYFMALYFCTRFHQEYQLIISRNDKQTPATGCKPKLIFITSKTKLHSKLQRIPVLLKPNLFLHNILLFKSHKSRFHVGDGDRK